MNSHANYGVTRRVLPTDEEMEEKKVEKGTRESYQNGNGNSVQELLMQDGEKVKGDNKVMLQGYIAFQRLTQTSGGHARLTALMYIPVETKDGRKKYSRPIQAWDDIANDLNDIPAGTPLKILGQLSSFSWNDQETGKKITKMDVKVDKFQVL